MPTLMIEGSGRCHPPNNPPLRKWEEDYSGEYSSSSSTTTTRSTVVLPSSANDTTGTSRQEYYDSLSVGEPLAFFLAAEWLDYLVRVEADIVADEGVEMPALAHDGHAPGLLLGDTQRGTHPADPLPENGGQYLPPHARGDT
jgi:hypothetical protein